MAKHKKPPTPEKRAEALFEEINDIFWGRHKWEGVDPEMAQRIGERQIKEAIAKQIREAEEEAKAIRI